MTKQQQFDGLLHDLRLNYSHDSGTVRQCATTGCNKFAADTGLCSNCIEAEIAELLDDPFIADSIHILTRLTDRAVDRALNAIEDM